MTAIARFEVIPVRDGTTATRIARALEALDQFPVTYETTPTDTVIEADTAEQVFAAVQAAHAAIPDDRVITTLQVDELRGRRQHLGDRVASVERALGRPPRRIRPPDDPQSAARTGPGVQRQAAGQGQHTAPRQPASRQAAARQPPLQ